MQKTVPTKGPKKIMVCPCTDRDGRVSVRIQLAGGARLNHLTPEQAFLLADALVDTAEQIN